MPRKRATVQRLRHDGGGRSMVETFYDSVYFYQKYAIDWWNRLGPTGYLTLLSIVGVIGYLSMLKGPKRI